MHDKLVAESREVGKVSVTHELVPCLDSAQPVEVVVLQAEPHKQHTLGEHDGLQDPSHRRAPVCVPNAAAGRTAGRGGVFN